MDKEFVPYEQALELKELGFNEPCFANYTVIPEDEIDWFTIPEQGITDKTSFGSSKNYNSKSFEEEGTISAPTFSQAFRWLLKEYNLYAIIIPTVTMHWTFKTMTVVEDIVEVPPYDHVDANDYGTREEAELACLVKLIEIVETRTK